MTVYETMQQYYSNLDVLITKYITHKNSIKRAKAGLLIQERVRVGNWLKENKPCE